MSLFRKIFDNTRHRDALYQQLLESADNQDQQRFNISLKQLYQHHLHSDQLPARVATAVARAIRADLSTGMQMCMDEMLGISRRSDNTRFHEIFEHAAVQKKINARLITVAMRATENLDTNSVAHMTLQARVAVKISEHAHTDDDKNAALGLWGRALRVLATHDIEGAANTVACEALKSTSRNMVMHAIYQWSAVLEDYAKTDNDKARALAHAYMRIKPDDVMPSGLDHLTSNRWRFWGRR